MGAATARSASGLSGTIIDDLRRSIAPIPRAAWAKIDETAAQVLRLDLAARKLVEFRGPLGWGASSLSLGRIDRLSAEPASGVTASVRKVQPLVELRATFELSREELDDVARGAEQPDLDPLIAAAAHLAYAEDRAVFHGYAAGGITGLCAATPHAPVRATGAYESYPPAVAEATRVLRMAGVDGPYALALGPACYTGLSQAMGRGGYPVLDVVRQLVGGPVVWAPALEDAVVLSMRGGDFELAIGQDVSIGYDDHTTTTVRLYLIESMTFRILAPEAAVVIAPAPS